MMRASYAAEVTLTAGQRFASLGGVTVRNRRLALLWLRRQALRLANGHGGAVRDEPPGDVRPVVFHGSDAPEGLRLWATDHHHQDDAIRTLEAGLPLRFTVLDPAVGLSLTLAGWHASPADHP
ncbi:hypothetical protein ACTFBT_27085 [Streptomyces microflavus]|uniref:Uncharacterized protein n=1 Tax=Streptomyces microflavus TaxID=1919 RepID=A0A7J0CXM3_STRMI|nr:MULTISPECIES: hypothetical protein [Streptomyces]MDX2975319.1 hypothetical protein [Streptomyces sp. NRRL_B-2249]WSS34114.1 hypothetical protein OG269_11780 [Streptomyces microflavus]WST17320.1 hypothetical protein OG721_26765 [Streptomyces microflavus]SCK08626.1 hypothetical protein YUYDRAFT_00526 [Streptomyces sp. ScaeMP-e48]GFN07019.1 hypothetical protein Smic_55750 [Streptomyces microflavus]